MWCAWVHKAFPSATMPPSLRPFRCKLLLYKRFATWQTSMNTSNAGEGILQAIPSLATVLNLKIKYISLEYKTKNCCFGNV